MVKNIFLVDSDLEIVDSILAISNLNLCGLYVNSTVERDIINLKYPELDVYIFSDIINWNKTYASANDIRRYVATQLKCERDLSRYLTFYGNISSYYYHALAFWKYIFDNSQIDCLIVSQVEHGALNDSIPLDVAISYGIPAYTLDPLYANSKFIYSGIKNHQTGNYINLLSLSQSKRPISLSEVMNQNKSFKSDDLDERMSYIPFPILRKLLQFYLACYGRILKFIGKDGSDIVEYQLIFYEYLFKCYFWINALLNKSVSSKNGTPRILNYRELAKQVKLLKKRNKYYLSHCASQISKEKNSIVYALHFEPEASILNRTTYNSQLYNITMLSKSLPHDWILYVKEHPHQIRVDNSKSYWYLHKLDNYRSLEFYSQLLDLPNVQLLDYNITSDSLLSEYTNNDIGLKAISTINGTISLEALEKNIPVILFDRGSTAYSSDISNLYVVDDFYSLQSSISKISTDGVVCTMSELSKITDYLFRFKDDDISEILANLVFSVPKV